MIDEEFTVRNAVAERFAAADVSYGINVRAVRSGEIAHLARATGHDFLYIDTQHALFDLEAIAALTQVSLGCGVAPLVRVRSATDPDISVLLDAGVLGIVAPDVVSADQARDLVKVAKYPPVGRRSLSGFTVHSGYRHVPTTVQMRAENAGVLVFCMIESREGLDAVEEIAAVPGVDGIYLGINDLLADLGLPGQYDHPAVDDALARLVTAAGRHGLVPGAGGIPRPPYQAAAIKAGIRFLTTASDLGLLRGGLQQARDAIQERL
ncbi:HpcH/HpaI aldolase family protein [Streptomyces tagetis]|uniref:HpcH/HpaI aldolase/citrate lyase domain-containing protein n=1 Tax=Streptomyces tagetis TaxID=2820809 RepID=A0A940XEX9_9ACTN|nr:aldolase/citrate lyase family protein [Streptomyces sp. RG38]MBQ0827224.1 hypothetical protein [Streptomyces sp. RG38]